MLGTIIFVLITDSIILLCSNAVTCQDDVYITPSLTIDRRNVLTLLSYVFGPFGSC